jgi:hypothetical protein
MAEHEIMPARPDSTLLVEITQLSGHGMAVYETTTGDIEIEYIHDDGVRDVFWTDDSEREDKEVIVTLCDEIHRLRALLPTPSDRAALSIAAFELKERRANYAAMLQGFERGGADTFVIESYRDSVKACDAAIKVCERLAKR